MKKYDFITIGGVMEDITFYTDGGILLDNKKDILRQRLLAFEYGAKIQVDKSYSTFGGGASNTAVCFSRLGFKTACLSAVGNDFRGLSIIANLKRNGVFTGLIKIIENIETGYSFFLVGPGNEHVCFTNRAANAKLTVSQSDLAFLKKAHYLYISSLSGGWPSLLQKIFFIKPGEIIWNPGQKQIEAGVKALARYLRLCKILLVNKDEAIELAVSDAAYRRRQRSFLENINNLLVFLKNYGPKIVVVTNGKQGADAYDGNKFYHQNILKEKKCINTTGVGDAFGSTFAAGLEIFRNDIAKAMYLAVKNTASVVGYVGAQNGLLTKKEILLKVS